MTDPRDAMINAARALHDRDPDNPTACAVCTDDPHPEYGTPQMAAWPCPTAVALGATGRSEWTNTPTVAIPDPRCTHTGGQGRCILNADHRPGHITSAGDYPRCRSARSTLNCVMAEGHLNSHFDIDGVRWGGCGQVRVAGMELYPCVLEDGHEYGHRDQVGKTW
jgi:hypothetical protein